MNALNLISEKRNATEHHLETIVVGRIMRTSYCNAGTIAKMYGGKVKNRRRHHAYVDDVNTSSSYALHQGVCQAFTGQATITAHTKRGLTRFKRH